MTALDHTPGESFIERRMRIKAERDAAQRPAAPAPALSAPVTADHPRAAAWVAKKLQATLDDVAGAPEGQRNHTLNAAAYSLGRLVPKHLDGNAVGQQLLQAAHAAGLDDGEARATIRSGLTGGMDDPRDPPIDPIDPDDPSGGLAGLVAGGAAMPAQRDATPPVSDPETLNEEDLAALNHERRVYAELVVLRARHDARELHQAEILERTFRAPGYTRSLADELAIPDEPVQYAVDELLPAGGNALLAAQFKAGKTTLMTNLLRAYADNELFLGRFTVTPGAGRIAIFNYELSPQQYRRWLRASGIRNAERVAVLHLRGYRLPLTVKSVEDWIVAWLLEHEVSFWIADPFARAATGTDENSNTEVGVWLDTFDVIKERAGVSEAVLPTHTGRVAQEQGQERARGATRLDDWADVRWLMTKDETDRRFFRATGRDVELAEELLSYDEATRSLTYGGGDRTWIAKRDLQREVWTFIRDHPGVGVKAIELGIGGNKKAVNAARIDLLSRHAVRIEPGDKNAQLHYVNGDQA